MVQATALQHFLLRPKLPLPLGPLLPGRQTGYDAMIEFAHRAGQEGSPPAMVAELGPIQGRALRALLLQAINLDITEVLVNESLQCLNL